MTPEIWFSGCPNLPILPRKRYVTAIKPVIAKIPSNPGVADAGDAGEVVVDGVS
jgi:hypothetical protein